MSITLQQDTGMIVRIYHEPGSGIATVELRHDSSTKQLNTDAGPMFRSMIEAFGSVADAIGKVVNYWYDGDMMTAFDPVNNDD